MNKKIALLGEILVDMVVSNDLIIKPCPGGSLYNTASSLSKLDTKTSFYSHIGDDYWGQYLINTMNSLNINHDGIVKSKTNKTPLAFAVINDEGCANYDFYQSKFTEPIITGDFSEVGIFHYGSIFSMLPENKNIINNFIDEAKKINCIISYDPNYRINFSEYKNTVFDFMKRSAIIKASIEDLENLFGVKNINEAFDALNQFNPTLSIITLGKDGSALKSKDRKYIKIDGLNIEVVDTIGAGDNFSAGYLYYLYLNKIYTTKDLSLCNDDFFKKMLIFASSIAGEALKIKGANIPNQNLIKFKNNVI
jgi:fructokinase